MNRIIKCNRSSNSLADPVKLQPMDVLMGEGTTDPVGKAKREADIIIRSARSEAQSIKDEAHAQGYKTGLDAGKQQVQNLIERLEMDYEALTVNIQAILDEIEPEVLKLCVEAVEKIIRHEIKTDPRVVLRVVKSCLRRVRDTSEIRIRVNPGELAEIRAHRDELLSLADGLRSISIVDDRRVSSGGCVVETPSGDFDATINTQVGRINKKLGEIYEDGFGSASS